MTTRESILPENATTLERSLEQATARIADVPTPLSELWNPATCPLDLLPWLAWALSADRWETDWTESQKRDAVANAIELQRKKGTPASIDAVLASFDDLLTLTEWFEMRPPGAAHTFDIDLPLIDKHGQLGGERSSAAFAEAIIRDVARMKPARSHFRLLQSLEGEGSVRVVAAGRAAGYVRGGFVAHATIEPEWATYLTTAIGEPLVLPGGGFLTFATPHVTTGADYALAIAFKAAQYWEGGTQEPSLAALPGYAFTRSGAVFEMASSGHATVGFAAGVPAIVPGVGYLSRAGWENGITSSRDLTDASWNKRGTGSVTTDGTPRSDGTGAASKVTVSTSGNDVYATAYSFGSAAGRFKDLLIKKVSAAGILQIASPYDGSGEWSVDLSLIGASWERLTPRHPAVTVAAAATNSGIHFRCDSGGPLTFYVDFCQCLSVDAPNPPLIETTGAVAAIGASDLHANWAIADADQLIWVTAIPDTLTTAGNRFLFDLASPDGANRLAFYLSTTGWPAGLIVAGGAVVLETLTGQAAVAGSPVSFVLRRLAGQWAAASIVGGNLSWGNSTASLPAGITKAFVGQSYAGGSNAEMPIRGLFVMAGTFDTDAKVSAAISGSI